MNDSITQRLKTPLDLLIGMQGIWLVVVLFAAGILYGFPGIVLTLSAGACIALACLSHQRYFRLPLFMLAALCVWFLAVHRVYRYAQCPTCRYIVEEYTALELFRVPIVTETRRSSGMIFTLAKDFGCPCKHELMPSGYPLEDCWGLVFCTRPVEGTFGGFADMEEWDKWYHEVVRPRILRLKEERPDLAEEYCRRVIREGDIKYFIEFHDEVLEKMLKIPNFDTEDK